jgi:hypothetical protein
LEFEGRFGDCRAVLFSFLLSLFLGRGGGVFLLGFCENGGAGRGFLLVSCGD